MAGPRSDPPMPMLTTARIRRPVTPVHSPDRMRSATAPIRVEHVVHVGDHVASVDHQVGAAWHAQGHVQHRPVLGGVDPLPGEHGVASLGDPGPAGHRHQRAQRSGVDPVLGVVEQQVAGGGRHRRSRVRVLGEQVAEVALPQAFELSDQVTPLIGGDEVDDAEPSRRVPGPVHVHSPPWSSGATGTVPRTVGTADGRWPKLTNDYRPITERSRGVHLPLLLSPGMAGRHHAPCPRSLGPGGPGHPRGARPLPSGVLDPAAPHGDPARTGPAGAAVQQRCHRPFPSPRRWHPAVAPCSGTSGARDDPDVPRSRATGAPRRGAPVILIIDDDHLSRDSLAATLSVEGFDVVTAATGEEGIALADVRTHRPW